MTPPAVKPLIIYFCRVSVNMMMGIRIIVPEAASCPHFGAYCPMKPLTAMGAVFVALPVRINAYIYSFHAMIKPKIAATTSPGAVSGRKIFQKTSFFYIQVPLETI